MAVTYFLSKQVSNGNLWIIKIVWGKKKKKTRLNVLEKLMGYSEE